MFRTLHLAFGALILLLGFSASADTFRVPALSGPVVDAGGMLSADRKEQLDAYLRRWVERGGAQIQVATVPDLGGLSIEEASIRITDQWKLGKKKEDRGILLLLAASEHRVRIEVGQGLEGDLPDATANRIVQEIIVPQLKAGSPDRAVLAGVMAIGSYTNPSLANEIAPMPRAHQSGNGTPLRGLFHLLLWLIVFLFFILPPRGRRSGMSGFLLGSVLGGGFGGGGGGSWGGGGGGGGWSGGGGGFSGGGASGSW